MSDLLGSYAAFLIALAAAIIDIFLDHMTSLLTVVGQLGVAGSLVAAAIAVVRDRLSNAISRRSAAAASFVDAVREILAERSLGVTSAFDRDYSRLASAKFAVLVHTTDENFRTWVDQVATTAQYATPVPDPETIIAEVTTVMLTWSRRPSRWRDGATASFGTRQQQSK